jgi:hypothetical protein
MFDPALDLSQNRIERVLQRAVERIALGGPQLLEIGEDPLTRLLSAVAASQITGHILP